MQGHIYCLFPWLYLYKMPTYNVLFESARTIEIFPPHPYSNRGKKNDTDFLNLIQCPACYQSAPRWGKRAVLMSLRNETHRQEISWKVWILIKNILIFHMCTLELSEVVKILFHSREMNTVIFKRDGVWHLQKKHNCPQIETSRCHQIGE